VGPDGNAATTFLKLATAFSHAEHRDVVALVRVPPQARQGRGVVENDVSIAERSTTNFSVDAHTDTRTRFVVEYYRPSCELV
jgi:hypothetical protein